MYWSSCKVAVILVIVMKIEFSGQILKNILINLHENPSSGGLLLLLLLLIWLYNSHIEFWPSQLTLSIFFYLGQGSSSLVLLSSVYLF